MAELTVSALKRVFRYNGVQIADPGEALTPLQVRDLFAATYPEIVNAAVDGPKFEGDAMVFDFVRAVRDKG